MIAGSSPEKSSKLRQNIASSISARAWVLPSRTSSFLASVQVSRSTLDKVETGCSEGPFLAESAKIE
jgi:hypothetical protein